MRRLGVWEVVVVFAVQTGGGRGICGLVLAAGGALAESIVSIVSSEGGRFILPM
jgi:hypothetical protein